MGIGYTDTTVEVRLTLDAFDAFLHERGLRYEGVIVGGAALNLQGTVDRPTKDCDVLEPRPPDEVVEAARAFAALQRKRGDDLDDHWLNDGPGSLADVLPEGWRERVELVFDGRALRLRTLGREDLLRSKLFALCDRGIDLADCLAMRPTPEELEGLQPWLEEQDGNPGWPRHVRENLDLVAKRLGHGV